MGQVNDRPSQASTHGNLAVAYQALGAHDQALQHYLHHLSIARDLGDTQSEARALGGSVLQSFRLSFSFCLFLRLSGCQSVCVYILSVTDSSLLLSLSVFLSVCLSLTPSLLSIPLSIFFFDSSSQMRGFSKLEWATPSLNAISHIQTASILIQVLCPFLCVSS